MYMGVQEGNPEPATQVRPTSLLQSAPGTTQRKTSQLAKEQALDLGRQSEPPRIRALGRLRHQTRALQLPSQPASQLRANLPPTLICMRAGP